MNGGRASRATIQGDEGRRAALARHPDGQIARRLHYSGAMLVANASNRPSRPAALLGWHRVRVALAASILLGLLNSMGSLTPTVIVVSRAVLVGLCCMLAFGLIERRPAHMPRWLARWVLQIMAILITIPIAVYLAYWLTTGGHPNLFHDKLRMAGYASQAFTGILFAPWIAVAALVRQREDFARDQATAFALERSELERRALDARFRLLQAQVEPHFLFNTLANVQELVESGAPQASRVLGSLIAYLRAAVPRLHEAATSLGQEIELVRAYLDLMQMRMPDRLQFDLRVDAGTGSLQCPPMTLLTLVENAVRHGVDPSESGGRIDIDVRMQRTSNICQICVTDTGVGLQQMDRGLGTGLASLRERLQITFGGEARLSLQSVAPRGARAELSFPARPVVL